MSGRDFDLGLQSPLQCFDKSCFCFFLFFFLKYCTAVLQMSWCLLLTSERYYSGKLLAFRLTSAIRRRKARAVWISGTERRSSWVNWATVYNILHKRLLSLCVIVNMNVPYLHITSAGYCWGLRGESNISVFSWRRLFPLCHFSPILGYAIHLDYSIVYCAFV